MTPEQYRATLRLTNLLLILKVISFNELDKIIDQAYTQYLKGPKF